MNFLKFKNVDDFLEKTGLSLKEALNMIETEISKFKK